jgi:hypothetical protein
MDFISEHMKNSTRCVMVSVNPSRTSTAQQWLAARLRLTGLSLGAATRNTRHTLALPLESFFAITDAGFGPRFALNFGRGNNNRLAAFFTRRETAWLNSFCID